eukprot:CAMPEP_0198147626 /NCGR_PEP_ID=MMETSP1443-20131203/36908_1 /TAXON_ID=186043 /ORGANISM="Entomoneis sp., Strain CCMP2396" /LENGTH=274 /DNA_ID=CAMNT_0043812035 /DNA_START=246 /DNA_END=1070 /DNA_ORIENTATION=+
MVQQSLSLSSQIWPKSLHFQWTTLHFCLILSLWLCEYGSHAFSAVVTVKPYNDECFMFRTPVEWKKDIKKNPRYVWGNFELISSSEDKAPVHVYLATYDLESMLYRSRRGQTNGHFDVSLDAGKKFWFCIVNNLSVKKNDDDEPDEEEIAAKVPAKVGFSFDFVTHDEFDYSEGDPLSDLAPDDETTKAHDQAKKRSADWMKLGSSLQRKLSGMKKHFDYLRVREADHRDLTERTFSSILGWTAAEACTVTLVAIGQIMYLRRFIERSRQHYGL